MSPPTVLALRAALALCALAGAVLLLVATPSTIIKIKVLTTASVAAKVDTTLSGFDRHGIVLVVLAVLALVALARAVRGGPRGRLAAVGIAVVGAVTLGVAIIGDAHNIHDTGEVGVLYEDASAGAGSGFYEETLGGALLLIAGGGTLVLSAPATARPRRSRRGGADEGPRTVAASPTAQPRADDDDWFSGE